LIASDVNSQGSVGVSGIVVHKQSRDNQNRIG